MTIPSLDSCESKLRWAKHHLDTLETELRVLLEESTHRITYETDEESLGYIFYIHDLPTAPDHWPMLIGDCVHNLRSSLDFLAYQLAILGQNRSLTEDESRSVSFPVFSNPGEFAKRGAKRVDLLRASEQARIEELQPFNAWDTSIWGDWPNVPAVLPGTLERISTLDNIDKHRTIHTAFLAIDFFGGKQGKNPLEAQLRGLTTSNTPLEDGAEIGRWHFRERPLPDLSKVDVKRQFPLGISIQEPTSELFMQGTTEGGLILGTVDELLNWMLQSVARVIGLFIPCFASGAPPRSLR